MIGARRTARAWAVVRRHPLLGLMGLLVALRVTAIATSIERVSYWEELYRGTIAKELVDGLKARLWEYQADDYAAGNVIVGLLAAPLYAAVGPRLVALKVVPLAISVLGLGLLWRLLDRYFGRRPAVIGGLLYVLAPPAFTQLSLLAMGFHSESVPIGYGMFLMFYRLLEAEEDRAARWALGLGLVMGLGWTFAYITALTAATCVLSAVALRPRWLRAPVGAALLLGLGIGLVPWAAYNAAHGWRGLEIIGRTFATPSVEGTAWPSMIARHLTLLLGVGVPRSLGFVATYGVPGWALSYGYAALATVAVVAGLTWRVRHRDPDQRTTSTLPLVVYPIVFVTVAALTTAPRHLHADGTPIDFRYFAPLQGLTLPLVAVALDRARARGLVIGLLVLGGVGQASLLFNTPPRHLLDYRGYSYVQLGQIWNPRRYRSSSTFVEAAPLLARFDDVARRDLFWGLTQAEILSSEKWWPGDPRHLEAMLEEVAPAHRALFVEMIAARLADLGGEDPGRLHALLRNPPDRFRSHFYLGFAASAAAALRYRPVAEYIEIFRDVDPREHFVFYRHLGGQFGDCLTARHGPGCRQALDVFAGLPPAAAAEVQRGAGWHLALVWLDVGDVRPVLEIAHRLSDEARTHVLWGVGWCLRDWFKEDRRRALDMIEDLPADWRSPAHAGVTAFDDWYGLSQG